MSAARLLLTRVADRTETPVTGDILVGRLEDAGLRISQGLPSRRHAQISLIDGVAWVEDLGSVNGTFVNGVRIATKTKLRSGDRLRFDVEEFEYRAVVETSETLGGDKTLYRKSEPQQVEEQAPKTIPLAAHDQAPASKAEPVQVEKLAPSPPASAVTPAPQVVAEASGIYKRPGAWADPDSEDGGGSKTKFMDPAALKAMMAQSHSADAPRGALVDVPHLLVLTGGASGAVIKLQNGISGATEWTIGSGPEREVVFADVGVSALHAKIVNDGARWKLVDQMSANGTFVNGKRSNVSFLSTGDRIRFGPVECEFKLPAALAEAAARRVENSSAGSSRRQGRIVIVAIGLVALLSIALIVWWLFQH